MPESLGVDELNRRFSSAPLPEEKADSANQLVQAIFGLAILVNRMCPAGREAALALTNLEQVKYWALAAVEGAR